MKKQSILFDYSHKIINIKWHRPVLLKDNWDHYEKLNQDNIFLYKIIGKRGNVYKLIYIGMSEKQSIQKRLFNVDHLLKQRKMKDENKNYVLYSSVGEFYDQDEKSNSLKWAKTHVKVIEKLLIISHSDFESLYNKKGINWFKTGAWLTINNRGFTKDAMYKTISYGLTTS